jgi:hypothetical protein
MGIMGKKREDGKYYIKGRIIKSYVQSGKPEDIFMSFLVDTSQIIKGINRSKWQDSRTC